MLEMTVLLANCEGALVRVLGTIERRGFQLGAMKTLSTPRGLQLTLSLASDARPADILLRQLLRLHDVADAQFDIARPTFSLPAGASLATPALPKPTRRGMSFLGIPERISAN